MEARVKQTYWQNSVQALAGQEYLKSEWRPVPAEREDEARRHPLLDTQDGSARPSEPEPDVLASASSADAVQTDAELDALLEAEPNVPNAAATVAVAETTQDPQKQATEPAIKAKPSAKGRGRGKNRKAVVESEPK